ncbi:hypothetical protein HK096_000446 [Nowakowskiella sp. JEL0078]|nr:hypothetical protein HK096_000446 [Nowakowskiella sp. JEL0078]
MLTRLYSVLERQLSDGKPYLIGNDYSVADIASVGWVWGGPLLGIKLKEEFPHVAAWLDRVLVRPAVDRGVDVPDVNSLKKGAEYLQIQLEESRKWIREGMKSDNEKFGAK